jgi:predicted acylesterase/phospholipase RssA
MEASQKKFCDIVMKGGITSGVVYPPVVVKLAEHLHFKNIGGTSAGAIAAAATAAAQYRKNQTHDNAAFARLAALPKQLGETIDGQTRLLSLFQPQPQTKAIYAVLLTAVAGQSKCKVLSVAAALVRQFPLATLLGVAVWTMLGLLPVLALAWRAWPASPTWSDWWLYVAMALACAGLVVGLITATLLALAGPVAILARRTLQAIPQNLFGLCSGFVAEIQADKNRPPLTTWLADLIDELAGLPPGGEPLTFGQLWSHAPATPSKGDVPELVEEEEEAERFPSASERAINLEMMTTCLTNGRPYRLPFETRIFFYRPDEFAQLFPARVTAFMEKHSEPALPHVERMMQKRKIELTEAERQRLAAYRRLPEAEHLPVIVATRMSLSFPILLSAVPLHAIDFSRRQHVPERLWFSDGGICSNFPVHFFDSALPQHPTFAVNLRPLDPERRDQFVTMPRTNNSGLLPVWMRFDDPHNGEPLFGFFNALLNALQNWSDNAQTHLPGYRDRIVTIHLDESKEGGLNLDMPADLIAELGQRGAEAAGELLKRYPGIGLSEDEQKKIKTTWTNHRWVRYRSLLAQLEALLGEFRAVAEAPLPGELRYEDLIAQPPSYRYTPDQQRLARKVTEQLLELGREWKDDSASLQPGPRPVPELRVRPRL